LIKIVILGATSSGKTSITQRFIFDTFNSPYLNSASKVRRMELEGKSAVFSVVNST
jgi:GTPase SAR1 family protein